MCDITSILAVGEMPSEVQEACLERGHDLNKEMTIIEAMAEWFAWEIGNPGMGRSAAEYVSDMGNRNSIL